jgi:D-alanyl-D-alanine carboxypeptidase
MRKRVHHRPGKFIRRHIVGIVAIPTALLVCAGVLYWYNGDVNAQISKINKASATQAAADDITIKAIKARKAAELVAKQEAAAKITAENAKTADDSTATTVDSSTCNIAKSHNNPASIDVVVNKKHCIQPVTYVPGDLVNVGGGFLLSAKAADSFHAMMDAASAAGEPIALTSSYRSYSDQVSTYAYWVNTSGKDGADTYSARPGYSEHQTGLAFDVADANKQYVLSNFGSTSQYQWLQAHAADYGFIQRYYAGYETITGYQAEEWHYRYVGVTVAKDMRAKGIKTLEQYWGVSGGDYF